MTKITCFLLIMLVLFITACSSSHSIATAPSATVTTFTPVPTAAISSQLPLGKYLFLELSVAMGGSGDCPKSYIDFPSYSYVDASLHLPSNLIKSAKDLDPIKGFFGREWHYSSQAVGYGSFSELYVISTFPYINAGYNRAPFLEGEVPVTIDSVNTQGMVIVEVSGITLQLQPNEIWEKQGDSTSGAQCHGTTTLRLTNYGLLDKNQIKF